MNMISLIKEKQSKLAPFEETLFAMDAAKNTLAEMRQWLANHGVTISFQSISRFLASRRKRRWQAGMLGQIASGLPPLEQVKTAFQTHPEPDLDTLIKLSRFFIFEHATKLVPGSERVGPSAQVTKMVLNYINRQAKQGIKKSEIALAERKLVIREASARQNALNQTKSLSEQAEHEKQ